MLSKEPHDTVKNNLIGTEKDRQQWEQNKGSKLKEVDNLSGNIF